MPPTNDTISEQVDLDVPAISIQILLGIPFLRKLAVNRVDSQDSQLSTSAFTDLDEALGFAFAHIPLLDIASKSATICLKADLSSALCVQPFSILLLEQL